MNSSNELLSYECSVDRYNIHRFNIPFIIQNQEKIFLKDSLWGLVIYDIFIDNNQLYPNSEHMLFDDMDFSFIKTTSDKYIYHRDINNLICLSKKIKITDYKDLNINGLLLFDVYSIPEDFKELKILYGYRLDKKDKIYTLIVNLY